MRRTELRRVSAKREAGLTKPPRRRQTGPSAAVRSLVIERDQRACASCGKPIGSGQWSMQHRLARGAGGSSNPLINAPSNLIVLCGSANTPHSCHLAAESRGAESHGNGFWLHHGQDPATVPVQHALHGWVLLTAAGGWSPAPLRGAA
jgi:5-methylcytosine-specific restriction enzyme A